MKNHEESRIQKSAVSWFRNQYPHHVLFAVPNGGARSKIEAAIFKGEGVLAGVADIFITYSCGLWNGLFVEFKTETGRQSNTQKEFQKKVQKFGYHYVICRSLEDFKITVKYYINN